MELQQRLIQQQAELQAVRARLQAAKQSKNILNVTQNHVRKEQTSDHVWQGVGRMFIKISTAEHEKETERRSKEIDDQIKTLENKERYFVDAVKKLLEENK